LLAVGVVNVEGRGALFFAIPHPPFATQPPFPYCAVFCFLRWKIWKYKSAAKSGVLITESGGEVCTKEIHVRLYEMRGSFCNHAGGLKFSIASQILNVCAHVRLDEDILLRWIRLL